MRKNGSIAGRSPAGRMLLKTTLFGSAGKFNSTNGKTKNAAQPEI